MSDKIKLIKEEIERQIEKGKVKCQQSQENNDYESFVAWSEHVATCGKLLVFIDSLPGESGCEVNFTTKSDDLDYLVISLEETIGTSPHSREVIKEHLQKAAEWQKQKDFEELLKSDMSQFKECYEKGKADAMKEMKETLQTEYEKGRFDMREEMMKDAVEGTVVSKERSTMPPFQTKCKIVADRVAIDAEEGDKVTIIVIKQD